MSQPAVMVLRAPGINCERETHHAFELAGGTPSYTHVRKLLAEPQRLDDVSILAVPGGFSYGDDIAAGVVLGHELRTKIGDRLLAFVERGGLVLGICNGFQVLVRSGLLPRTDADGPLQQQVSLRWNLSNHYECRWVTLQSMPNRCSFLPEGLTMRCPAAHAEGYLMPPDDRFAQHLVDEGFCTFRYIDEDGEPTTAYPHNPNGSPLGLAGMTDATGRVLGLMPHPDRSYLPHHMPAWRREPRAEHGEGFQLFERMVAAAQ